MPAKTIEPDELLDGLQADIEAQRIADDEAYRAVVVSVAGGKRPDVAELQPLLSRLGKTLEHIREDCRLYRDRCNDAETLAEEADFEKRRLKAMADQEAEKIRFAKLKEEHEAKAKAIDQELNQANAGLDRCRSAHQRLANTSCVSRLSGEITAPNRELRHQVDAKRRKLQEFEGRARQARAKHEDGVAEDCEAKAKRYSAELAELERAMKENQARSAEIQKRATDPSLFEPTAKI